MESRDLPVRGDLNCDPMGAFRLCVAQQDGQGFGDMLY